MDSKLSAVGMALVVIIIISKAYGDECGPAYPNLAGKAKYAFVPSRDRIFMDVIPKAAADQPESLPWANL
jgi:hypothetical protein